jgi:1-acyl-sn-glycerol-3-phosphate acyltransferase
MNELAPVNKSLPAKYPSPLVIGFIRYSFLFVSKILWRIEYNGTENIPQKLESGLLVTPNHQTYFDPFWICLPIRRKYRFMAWDQAFKWFLIGPVIKYLGAFPVALRKGGVRDAIMQAESALRDGATLILFPEGSRCHSDGKLLPFKSGALKIAIETGVPILPVTIKGANKVWSQDIKYPRLKKVEIFFHPMFYVEKPPEGKDEREYLENESQKLKVIIQSKL